MSRPFTLRRNSVRVRLAARETEVLRELPTLLESVGVPEDDPAAERLGRSAYPGDPEADAEWRRFAEPELDRGRADDRSAFADSLGRSELTLTEAEGWLRTIGDARLVIGARLGIAEDGWSAEELPTDPVRSLLHYLSWLQEELVATLTGTLAEP